MSASFTSLEKAIDEAANHVSLLDRFTQKFSPFVKGMGPRGDFWKGRPVIRSSVQEVKDFLASCDAVTTICHNIIFKLDPGNNRALELLKMVPAYRSHLALHPATVGQLRSQLRQLDYYADQSNVQDRLAFILSKSSIDAHTGGHDYAILDAERVRLSRNITAEQTVFSGPTLAAACFRAGAALDLSRLVRIKCNVGGSSIAISESGSSEEEAFQAALPKIPYGATGIKRNLTHQGGRVNTTIIASQNKPNKCTCDALIRGKSDRYKEFGGKSAIMLLRKTRENMAVSLSRRVFGVPSHKWRVQWRELFKVTVIYAQPPQVTVYLQR